MGIAKYKMWLILIFERYGQQRIFIASQSLKYVKSRCGGRKKIQPWRYAYKYMYLHRHVHATVHSTVGIYAHQLVSHAFVCCDRN